MGVLETQIGGKVNTVLVLQLGVQQDQVNGLSFQDLLDLPAIGGFHDFHTRVFEQQTQSGADSSVIIHQ